MAGFRRGHEHPGIFFNFECGEGGGKSTHIELLAKHLEKEGYVVIASREPGGTKIGEQIRHVLQHSKESANMIPETELLLYEAARAQLFNEVVIPALKDGDIVLLDRGIDSTIAYQGKGRGLNIDYIELTNQFASLNIKPDLTFLIDVPVEVGLANIGKRDKYDRMEEQARDFYERVREGYLALAKQEPDRIKIIPYVHGEIDKMQEQIKKYAHEFIAHLPKCII